MVAENKYFKMKDYNIKEEKIMVAENKYFKIKVMGLLMLAFVFGGVTLVTMYASGTEVIEKNDNMYMVSHTEYRYNEVGQIVVRLVDFSGGAVAVDNCTATILYPNKTIYLGPALMSSTIAITGDHYYSFTTPANGPEGVYEYQALCTYAAGVKSKSATNSFHLSSAFSTLTANVAEINTTMTAFRAEVQSNFSTVISMLNAINYSSELAQINSTLNTVAANVVEINTSLAAFTAETYTRLTELNTTTQTISADLLSMNASLNSQFSGIYTAIEGNITWLDTRMQANFTQVLSDISALSTLVSDVNTSLSTQMTTINDNVLAINTSLSNQITAVNLSISSNIADFRQEVQANVSQILAAIAGIPGATDYSAILNQINQTTTDTYSYLTGTLATNINSILNDIGVINATVNRIEATTVEINTTVTNVQTNVSKILQNQEDEVFISTYSG